MYISDEARNSAFKTLWKEEDFSYLAILYCDANGDIGYIPIKTDNTLIYIQHEAWPKIDNVRFKSLDNLLDAQESNGFKQIPGEMDSIELPWSSYPDLPTTLQEQLNEPGMFMLDRLYRFQFQFNGYAPGPSAFPISVDGDSVYLKKGLISAMDEIRFADIDSLIKASATYGGEGRILDWNVNNSRARIPKITWQH
ncbi:hypothetical protein AN403_4407 [Pseudomonas fluorescens]|uniref:Uncharacterized protein n=1 Tax=Pseudomonas fluorescens TaxID=294 RepID=A0A0P8XTR1_PSEFL|nr:hypothetical protein [Pseudomonas fluorescens]KPU60667.1 hypothetical protein AN403_4407 [Pseudomonas fluorescens]